MTDLPRIWPCFSFIEVRKTKKKIFSVRVHRLHIQQNWVQVLQVYIYIYTIFTNKIFPHILTFISGYIWQILKNWWQNYSSSNLQAVCANRIFLTQCVQELFNFEWNISISLLPFHTIFNQYHFTLFWITSKQIELDRCGLRSLLANSKGFIYVTYFSMIRGVSLEL